MFSKRARYSFKLGQPKKVLYFPDFTLRYDKNGENLKVAVVVSKKVDKRATARNKVKRIFLEEIRKQAALEDSINLVFYIKKQALTSQTIETELNEAFNKIRNARDL